MAWVLPAKPLNKLVYSYVQQNALLSCFNLNGPIYDFDKLWKNMENDAGYCLNYLPNSTLNNYEHVL